MIFRNVEGQRTDKKIFMIFGSFSGANAGDTAVLESLIARLDLLFPKSRFYVPTTVPLFFSKNECLREYDIEPISMRRWDFAHGFFSPQLLNRIIRCDAVFTTANMFFDRHLFSPYANLIFSLFPVLLLYRMFRWKGKVIASSVSVTPPTSLLGKMVLKKVLELHDMVTLRDFNSKLVLSELSRKTHFMGCYPDIVISREINNNRASNFPFIEKGNKKLIGINLSSYFSGELLVPDKEIMSGWIDFFSKIVRALKCGEGNEVIFIMTSSTDEWIANEISENTGLPVQKYGPSSYNHNELHQLISQLDLYLSMRMHGTIFSFSAGVPCIGLCFTKKLKHFYSDHAFEEFMIDIRPTDFRDGKLLELMLDKINSCIEMSSSHKEKLKTIMKKCRIEHDKLFGLINRLLQQDTN